MTFIEAVAVEPARPRDGNDHTDAPDGLRPHRRDDYVAAAAFVAAIGAALTDAAPTGTGWWDLILRAVLATVFVVAGAGAPFRVLVGVTAVSAMFAGLTFWLAVAVVGFGFALAAFLRSDPDQRLRAVAAACAVQALLRLEPIGFFGAPSLIAGAAMLVVLGYGYRSTSPATRRRLHQVAVALGVAIFAVLIVGGAIGLSARSDANDGVAAARRGLALARAGETEALTGELELAEARLRAADSRLRTPLSKPLRLVPIAAQHHRSVAAATRQGAIVAGQALSVAQDADIEQLQLRQGQFDLAQLQAMAPLLDGAVVSLEAAQSTIERERSPWLVPPIDSQLQSLVDEVADVLPEVRLSADAARLMPDMLGIDGERRYLMLFGSPGESREFGGFVGGYALIGIDRGSLELIEAGSVNDLLARARSGELDHPDGYPAEYLAVEPAFWPQNLTSSPNIHLIARGVRDVFPELAGAPIDGVIYADPFALAAMTDFTGPLPIDGLDEPLDRDTLPRFIFRDQYQVFEGRVERFGAIGDLAKATAAGFENADLPGPERLGEVLGPVARAGRLQVVTYEEDKNVFLTSVKLQRQFVAPTEIDSLAVIQTNGTASKLDLYLHREIDYDVLIDDDGSLDATVEVRLKSDVPDDVPPLTFGETDGTNRVLLSLYSRHEMTELLVDGRPHEFVVHEEFGFFRYALFGIALAPNASATVRFELAGVPPPGDYRLAVWAQPLVNRDTVTVSYDSPTTAPFEASQVLEENWLFVPPTGS